MNILRKAAATSTAIIGLSIAALTFTPALVSADSPGQIDSGTGVYVVKNSTQSGSYGASASATCNDTLQFSIRLHNSGYGTLNNINVATTLPANGGTSNMTATYTGGVVNEANSSVSVSVSSGTLGYVSGSSELYDSNDNLIKDLGDGITGSGVNVGSLYGSTTEFLNYKAKVTCETPPTPPTPAYTCDLLSLTAEDNKTVKISDFKTTASNGATFANATVNWGDKSSNLTSANIVGQSHQYSDYGTYTVVATANFSVNGSSKSATSESCSQQVTFAPNTPPTVTPPTTTTTTPTPTPTTTTPTTLVNTGPGSVIAIFAAVSTASAVAYRYFIGRRLSRQ
jgi:hypothetical protein